MSIELVRTDLSPTTLSRAERSKAREIERIRSSSDIAAARKSAEIDIIESVTQSALLATAHLSALEGYLLERVPLAESRLRHIADGGCMAMADVVVRLAR